jgi:hypothetical protein
VNAVTDLRRIDLLLDGNIGVESQVDTAGKASTKESPLRRSVRLPLGFRIPQGHRPLFSVVQPSLSPGPGVKSPWSHFDRRLRRPCGSPWPAAHFGNVLHRVVTCSRLRLTSLVTHVHCGPPKNGGGSLSTVFASPWSPVLFLRRK